MNESDTQECQCPPKPYWSVGSVASGSATESRAHEKWEREHGHHANAAKARDVEEAE